MDSVVDRAREIAERVHSGQVDKLGVPYSEHVKSVAEAVSTWRPMSEAPRGVVVLCINAAGTAFTAIKTPGDWCDSSGQWRDPIAWMFIPKHRTPCQQLPSDKQKDYKMNEQQEVTLLIIVNEVINHVDRLKPIDDAIEEGMSPDETLAKIAGMCTQGMDRRDQLIAIAATAIWALEVLDNSALDYGSPDYD